MLITHRLRYSFNSRQLFSDALTAKLSAGIIFTLFQSRSKDFPIPPRGKDGRISPECKVFEVRPSAPGPKVWIDYVERNPRSR